MTAAELSRLSNLLFLLGLVGCSDDGLPLGGTEGASAGGTTGEDPALDDGRPTTGSGSATATATASNSGGSATTGPMSDSDSMGEEGSTSLGPAGSSTGEVDDGPDLDTGSGGATGTGTTGTGTGTGTGTSTGTTGTTLVATVCAEFGATYADCVGGEEDDLVDQCADAIEAAAGDDCYYLLIDLYACIAGVECDDFDMLEIECATELKDSSSC